MTRLRSAIKTDVVVQARNKLYAIGIGVGVFLAVLLAWLAGADHLSSVVPATLLLFVGGTTMFYVAGMMIFERDEGTLHAVIVSPLRTSEYLWSKILSLTVLATLESATIVGGAMLLLSLFGAVPWPNVPLLLIGTVAIGVIYTLMGIVLIVRYRKITDFLIPVTAIVGVLQLPFLHFLGLVEHPAFLIIPTSAPTMLMQGAFVPLEVWEWVYGIVYTAAMIAIFSVWAYRAFNKHVIMNLG